MSVIFQESVEDCLTWFINVKFQIGATLKCWWSPLFSLKSPEIHQYPLKFNENPLRPTVYIDNKNHRIPRLSQWTSFFSVFSIKMIFHVSSFCSYSKRLCIVFTKYRGVAKSCTSWLMVYQCQSQDNPFIYMTIPSNLFFGLQCLTVTNS